MSKGITAALDELRARRNQLALDQADVEAAIATIERLAGNGGSPAAPPPATGRRAPSDGRRENAPARRPTDGADDRVAKQAAARAAYERGDDVNAIAKAAGVSGASIYLWAKKGKWKRPKPAASAVAATPKGEQLGGRVRCASCQTMTATDPCEACGTKLKRAWS